MTIFEKNVPPLTKQLEELEKLKQELEEKLQHEVIRIHYSSSVKMHGDGYDYYSAETFTPTSPEKANHVSSKTEDGFHAPVLDIDFPVRLVPSKTEGHFHLYLDIKLTSARYKRLLKALFKAGIIEKGYYRASIKQGQSLASVQSEREGLNREIKHLQEDRPSL